MSKPNILLLDIETAPDCVYTWGVYEQNAIEVREHWYILCYSAKWLDGEHETRGLCDYRGYKPDGDDKALIQSLWYLLDRADIVVAHNGRQFDIKKINARFLVHGMKPPSPYTIIDTKTEVKRIAAFSSNKLDWLCAQLHLGRKLEHQGFPLWRGCMTGDKASWKKMKQYNRHDVILLERLYRTLSPYIKSNAGMWAEGTVCNNPVCGSKHILSDGWRRTSTMLYRRAVCADCGHRMRIPKSEPREKPLVSV